MSDGTKKNNKKLIVSKLTTIAFLIALEVVLTRLLSIQQWNMRFSFGFIPVVITGILYGPVAGASMGAISDILGASLFPKGAFFPGFTLTAFLTGLIFALFLYKKQTMLRIIVSTLLVRVICGLLLDTLWLNMIMGTPYKELLVTRLFQAAIMTIVNIVVIQLISKELMPRIKMAMAR